MEDVENKSSILCGSFKTMFGNIGTTYHLWRHENFDEAQELRTMWISNQASNFIDFRKYYSGDHEFQAQFLPYLRKIQGLLSRLRHRATNFPNSESRIFTTYF